MTPKQDYVIRLKANIQLNRKKSLKRTPIESSNIVADFTCTLGTAQKQTKKRHRVVEFTDYEGAIESFFCWIKQNLNVPVLFGTTKNSVFSQLFVTLTAYVILKFLHTEGRKKNNCKYLSFAGFTRQFLCVTLPIESRIGLKEILEFH